MTKKLKDSIHELLYLCYRGSDISSVLKSFLKENRNELYDTAIWDDVIDKINNRFAKYYKHTGANMKLQNTDTLFLALGFLCIGDENRFDELASQYFEANNV